MSTSAPTVPLKKQSVVNTDFFDALKALVVLLPLAGAIYFALHGLLNLPYGEQVLGAVTSATASLAAFIHTNEAKYNASDARFDGVVNVVQTDAKKLYQLALNYDPQLIDQAETILLKVVKPLPAAKSTAAPVTIAESATPQPVQSTPPVAFDQATVSQPVAQTTPPNPAT
jgi:hypothetical protein